MSKQFLTPAVFFEEMEPMFVIHNISIATDIDIIHNDDDVNIYPLLSSRAIIIWGELSLLYRKDHCFLKTNFFL